MLRIVIDNENENSVCSDKNIQEGGIITKNKYISSLMPGTADNILANAVVLRNGKGDIDSVVAKRKIYKYH